MSYSKHLIEFWEALALLFPFLRTFCNSIICKAEVYPHLGAWLKRLRHRGLRATSPMVLLPFAGNVPKAQALCCSDFEETR